MMHGIKSVADWIKYAHTKRIYVKDAFILKKKSSIKFMLFKD